LSAVFRHKREEVTGENGMMRSFMVFISHHFLFRWSGRISWVGNMGGMRRRRGVYRVVMGRSEGKGPI